MAWFIRAERFAPEVKTDLIRTPDGAAVRHWSTKEAAEGHASQLRRLEHERTKGRPECAYTVIGSDD